MCSAKLRSTQFPTKVDGARKVATPPFRWVSSSGSIQVVKIVFDPRSISTLRAACPKVGRSSAFSPIFFPALLPPVFLSRQSAPIATIAPWKKTRKREATTSANFRAQPESTRSPQKRADRTCSDQTTAAQIPQCRNSAPDPRPPREPLAPMVPCFCQPTPMLRVRSHGGLFDRPKVRPCPPGRNESHVRS